MTTPEDTQSAAGKRLLSFLERIERLREEQVGLAADIREVYAEAKSVGFDAPTMRRIIKLRRMDTQTIREQNELLETYAAAIGLQYTMAL